jgi:hypothetical protein
VNVAGFLREVRNTTEGKHIAGYEAIYGDISHPDAERAAKDAVFNFFLSLLDDLENTPFVLNFGIPYAPVQVCVRHMIFIGDHPEANPEAGVSGSVKASYPCRDCDVRNEHIHKTSFIGDSAAYAHLLRDWESIDRKRWGIKLGDPLADTYKKELDEKNISVSFSGSHGAYGCDAPPADVDKQKHLGCSVNLRVPYEPLHAVMLGIMKHICLLVVLLVKQPKPNCYRADGVTIDYALQELDRRAQLFRSSKIKRGKYTPTFSKFNAKAGLRAEDYKYLSQMLLFIIGKMQLGEVAIFGIY